MARKIRCEAKEGSAVVEFLDYRDRNQLKDFYKIFKKASGALVSEYVETPEMTVVRTDNVADTVTIRWESVSGCNVRSGAGDAKALAGTVHKMLCYRYKGYGRLSETVAAATGMEFPAPTKAGEADADAVEDVKELLAMVRQAAG